MLHTVDMRLKNELSNAISSKVILCPGILHPPHPLHQYVRETS